MTDERKRNENDLLAKNGKQEKVFETYNLANSVNILKQPFKMVQNTKNGSDSRHNIFNYVNSWNTLKRLSWLWISWVCQSENNKNQLQRRVALGVILNCNRYGLSSSYRDLWGIESPFGKAPLAGDVEYIDCISTEG